MQPKKKDGSWREDFDPFSSPRNEYVEGNAWQYTFFVPQDVKSLVGLIGKEEFNKKLEPEDLKSQKTIILMRLEIEWPHITSITVTNRICRPHIYLNFNNLG